MEVKKKETILGSPSSTPPLDLEGANRRYLTALLGPSRPRCYGCGTVEGVALESSRTAYPFDGKPLYLTDVLKDPRLLTASRDPNKPVWLCRPCAEEHHAFWDEQWADYRRGQL